MASAGRKSKSNGARRVKGARFAICINNKDYPVSLERGKVYRVLPDTFGDDHGLLRVVDESGEDYLFSQKYFLPIALPDQIVRALAEAA
ncbi:MAG: hypothetical protein HY961_18065 [Ignavibacteriae bacterium]|nr:hypothetical protein [Ignavibacteriota bacterium]